MSKVWPDNVCAISNYRRLISTDSIEREFETDSVRFIYTGSLHKQKGCEELLDAFIKLNHRLAGKESQVITRLDIIGERVAARRFALDETDYAEYDNIVFHGSLPNDKMTDHYQAADVLVFPTYWPTEGHSGSVIEALMHGLPVITTNWRAMPEVIQDGENGLVCPVQDVDSLVDAMYAICTDVELRKRLSTGARRSATRFDHNEICGELLRLARR